MENPNIVATLTDVENNIGIRVIKFAKDVYFPQWRNADDGDYQVADKTYNSVIGAIRSVYVNQKGQH